MYYFLYIHITYPHVVVILILLNNFLILYYFMCKIQTVMKCMKGSNKYLF